jgi:hypothetical protein
MADDAQVDLAQARRLIALGCSLETAARILLYPGTVPPYGMTTPLSTTGPSV